jgi:type II secretory pathway pseudopilin PulG
MKLSSDKDCNLRNRLGAFSLVEVLAAVTIIGVVIFLAIPNIVQVRRDAEENLAKSRADALNVAVAAYFQAAGSGKALTDWSGKTTSQRFDLVSRYLAFAPTNFTSYMPKGYSVTFNETLPNKIKATLTYTNTGTTIDY